MISWYFGSCEKVASNASGVKVSLQASLGHLILIPG
jgi:hypothetical protein